MPLPQGTLRKDPQTGQDIQWDGQGWKPYTAPSAENSRVTTPDEKETFLGGLWKTVNPAGLANVVAHPLDTLSSLISAQTGQGEKAIDSLKRFMSTGSLGDVAQAAGHGAAALLPIVGPMAAHAGEVIGGGNVQGGTVTQPNPAGGLGEAVGLGALEAAPRVAIKSGPTVSAVGRGAEALGTSRAGRLAQAGGMGDMLWRGDLAKGAALAAAPMALEYGGRGLQNLGEAISALDRRLNPAEARSPVTVTDEGNVPSPAGLLPPARFSTEVPTEPAGGWQGYQAETTRTPPPQAATPTARPISDAEQFNIDRNAPYGEGAIMPATLPTELRTASLEGLDYPQQVRPYDVDYMAATGEKYLPESELVEPEAAPRQAEPSEGDVDEMLRGLSSGLAGLPEKAAPASAPQLPTSWAKLTEPPAAPGVSLPPSLQAIDKMFGPGATDTAGRPFQATAGRGGNNLIYDPQTPTDYLREQLSGAEGPDADFLSRALRQRMRLGTSQLNLQPQ